MEITGLPFELYQCILEYLNLPDLMRLRLVNKFFRQAVRAFRVKVLCFHRNEKFHLKFPHSDRAYWNFNYSPFHPPTNLISHRSLHLLKRPLFDIEKLKLLEIAFKDGPYWPYDIDDSHINRFVHLEELRILLCTYASYRPRSPKQDLDWKLSLPNLNKLVLKRDEISSLLFKLDVNAPGLRSLKLTLDTLHGKDGVLHLHHPSSVRSLRVDWFDRRLLAFENLEVLKIGRLDQEDDLSAFPRLHTLYVYSRFAYAFPKERVTRFIQKFRVIFKGIELVDGNEVGKKWAFIHLKKRYVPDSLVNPQERFMREFEIIFARTESSKRISIEYDLDNWLEEWLVRSAEASVPIRWIANKFHHLREIVVASKIEHPNLFPQFLAGCKCLSKLYLQNSSLPQEFYDLLPSITSLYDLEVREEPDPDLNFQFVSRMFRLKYLHAGCCLIAAIQNDDLQLTAFNGIDFLSNERGEFCAGLYRGESLSKSFYVRASGLPFQQNRPTPSLHHYFNSYLWDLPEHSYLKERVYPIQKMSNQVFLDFFSSFKLKEANKFHRACKII